MKAFHLLVTVNPREPMKGADVCRFVREALQACGDVDGGRVSVRTAPETAAPTSRYCGNCRDGVPGGPDKCGQCTGLSQWGAQGATPGAGPAAVTTVPQFTMNDELMAILGRPNFACIRIAHVLRAGGLEIKTKAECEQAAVILFLLNHYLADPKNWDKNANEELVAMRKKGGAA